MSSDISHQIDPPSHHSDPIDGAQRSARKAAREKRHLIEPLARIGYAARGLVYCLVGAVAVRGAMGYRLEKRGADATHAVLLMLWHGRFGSILLIAMGAGLSAYALWCFTRAIADPEWEGQDRRALMRRFGFFCSGLVYTTLVVWVLEVLASAIGLAHDPEHEHGAKHWTAKLMSFPLGRFLVMAVGIGFIVYAVMQVRLVWTSHWLRCDRRDLPAAERLVRGLGRFGFIARALVFAGIGSFLLTAAITFNARRAEGLSGTLIALRSEPEGPWLLGVVAAGLIAYGLYDLLLARYRILQLGPRQSAKTVD